MYYWNKQNFEGLKSIVEKYSEIPEFKSYADYCHYREIGLRKKATSSINKFLNQLKNYNVEKQRKIADELVALQYYNQQIHQLAFHPLQVVLIAILENWSDDINDTPIPNRWLGYLKHDMGYFEKSLEIDPNDQISIMKLAWFYIDDVDFQMHHLSESIFLGDETKSEKDLETALSYIKRIESKKAKALYIREFEDTKLMFELWKEYKTCGTSDDFPVWSKNKGHVFDFPSTYYYEK